MKLYCAVDMMTSHFDVPVVVALTFKAIAAVDTSFHCPRSFCLCFVAMTSRAREVARHSVHGPSNVVVISGAGGAADSLQDCQR